MFTYHSDILQLIKTARIRFKAIANLSRELHYGWMNGFEVWVLPENFPGRIQLKTEPRPLLKDYTGKSGFICRPVFILAKMG